MDVDEVKKTFMDDVHKLQGHHLTVNFMHIGVIVLSLVMVVGMYVHSVRVESENMGKFQAMFETYKTDTKKLQEDLKTSYEARVAESKLQANKQATIVYRDKEAAKATQEVTNPDATLQQVASDTQKYLGVMPIFTPDNNLAFGKLTVQGFISTKIDRDRLVGNLKDKTDQYESSQKQVISLTGDLGKQTALAKECNTTLEQSQKLKNPSKLKAVGEKILWAAGAFLLGRAM